MISILQFIPATLFCNLTCNPINTYSIDEAVLNDKNGTPTVEFPTVEPSDS